MATVNFLYRSTRDKAPLNLRLLFRHESEDYVVGAKTRLIVSKEYWTKQHFQKRPKDIEIANKQVDVNGELNKIENYILAAFNKISTEYVNKEWLLNVLKDYYNPNKGTKAPDVFLQYFDYYLKINKHLKVRTRRKILAVKHRLEKHWEKLGYSRNMLISDVNDDFRDRVYAALDNYAKNTIEGTLKEIKMLCVHADKKGVLVHKDVLNWKFKFSKTPIIYLTPDEIKAIQNLEGLPEYLDNARDWLVISCFTGQRVSDFMRFHKSMIRGEKNVKGKDVSMIEFTQIKTDTIMAIPLHKEVLKILEKRNGGFPRPISDVKYNVYIKKVCKRAGLTQLTEGSKKVKVAEKQYRKETGLFPKWELVSSHIGRRSFATNNYGKIPTALIMSATGHAKEDVFLAYIGKTRTEQAKSLADYY